MGIQSGAGRRLHTIPRALLNILPIMLAASLGCGSESTLDSPAVGANAGGTQARPVDAVDLTTPSATAAFQTTAGEVRVSAVRRIGDEVVGTIEWDEAGQPYAGTLTLDRAGLRRGWTGFRAHLRADDGQQFGLLVEWSAGAEGAEHIREWTATDRLDLELIHRDGVVVESYDVNGRQLQVTLDESGLPLGAKAPDTSIFQAAGTLNGNATGVQLGALLTQQQFGPWLGGLTRRGSSGSACPQWLSLIAQPCAFLKCTFGGGVLNPLCHVCVGTSWACWIADAVCLWADCD